MREQRVIFTALPQGLQSSGGRRALRLLAFISPRLYTDEGLPVPRLSQFPDFVDWPPTAISWKVALGNGSPVRATVTSPVPDSAAWKAVFSGSSFVQPYEFQHFSGRVTRSFPHAKVRGFAFDLYGHIAATSPLAFPARGALFNADGQSGALNPIGYGRQGSVKSGLGSDSETACLGVLDEFLNGSLAARTGDLGQLAQMTGGLTGETGMAMLQAKRFLRPRTPGPASGRYRDLPPVPPPAKPGSVTPPDQLQPDILDFHQVISAMSDHAGLLRALGLVVELTVPVPAGPLASTVHLVPTWTPKLALKPPTTNSLNVTPLTMLGATGWPVARSTNTLVQDGHLLLDQSSDFTLVEIDTEGASLKLLDVARTLWRLELNEVATPATPSSFSIPSLRQGGIAVAQLDRAWTLANSQTGQLAYADAINADAESTPVVNPTIGVEDITRGVRVDIYDETRDRWFQLCARSAPDAWGAPGAAAGYVLGSGANRVTVPVPSGDEGFVSTVVTSDSTPGGSTDLFLQETLFRWKGWSLISSRPGKTLGESPELPVIDQPGNPPAPNSDFPVQIDYVPTPGTLPLLRFGRKYRVRARVADLGGGGPGFDDVASPGSFQHATSTITYGRFEPVPPPVLLMRSPVSEGERLERLVIRSNYDIADDPPGTSHPKIIPSVRHVAAPAIAQSLAEEHGVFDGAGGLDSATYDLITEHANAAFGDIATNRPTLDPNLPSQHAARQTSGVYYDTDDLSVPYLPDVLARDAVFQNLPGAGKGLPTKVPFSTKGRSWPSSSTFELRLVGEGVHPPVLATSSNVNLLTVSLPKAAVAEIRYGSGIEPADLGLLGLWEWFRQQGAATAEMKAHALDGLVWLLTPPRTLVLVHAVRQPLVAPQFSASFVIQPRSGADTTAVLHDPKLSFDRSSSAKLDVTAQWDEWVDNGQNSAPDAPLRTAAPVGEIVLETTGGNEQGVSLVHRFGDTLAREASYSLTATTRFAEYFVERVRLQLHDAPVAVHAGGIMAGSAVVTGTYGGKGFTFLPGRDYTTDDAAGTIRRVVGGRIADGESVNVSFVPLPVTRSSLEGRPKTDLGVRKAVPSTARPAAPDVLYALPALSSPGPTQHGGKVTSETVGGALRVYLRRPWWSSGGGEQLGVVLLDPKGSSLAPYYTQWGADPLWKAHSLSSTGVPTTGKFPLAVSKVAGGLTLAEGTGTYGVAGHDVHFDPERDLWFCDIQLTTGRAYFPFVRMALVRYQPNSIAGMEMSGVVIADCSQTLPTRSTVVDISDPDLVSVSVTGYWYATAAASSGNEGPTYEAGSMYGQIEVQTPGLTDELSWRPAVPNDTVALTATTDQATGLTTWNAFLERPKAAGTYRLVVWEQQNWPTASTQTSGKFEARIVFFDAVAI